MATNTTLVVDESGLDSVINNARVRALKLPITVLGTGSNNVTFSPAPFGVNWIDGIGPPISITQGTAVTIYPGQLLTGVITIKPTASINLAFDTAAMIVAGVNAVTSGAVVGDYVTCLIINGAASGSGFNLTPVVSTGVTFDTNNAGIIAPSTSRYVLMRLTNVTPGSEAVVVYY
jgi:hypothetical protein